MALNLCVSYEALRKGQSLSAMITSLLSPHSPGQWVALAIDRLQHRYVRNIPIHTSREVFKVCIGVVSLPLHGSSNSIGPSSEPLPR